MASANDIRSTFLDYFAKNDHEVVASSPLVPRNDPTLMFVNSGMVQFKNVFTGAETRPYSRATTSQKCVRAGGKHNDLENVGYTARHHTFFEMLGNFSFGDYFKDRAIELAWNLVTKEYGLDPARLLITVYAEDDEAAALWKKISGFGDDKILRIATSDNFWQMGDTGPCGPCSEIFYDHGPEIPGGPPGSPDEDGDRFIEIWNLVFMQYEQVEGGSRTDLPRPSIDTGMGLERIAAVLQGVHDNYDTDLLRAIIDASADLTSVDPDGPQAASHKVIADHLRASAFLIADGVLPSNDGRGYVLRRIMRRAMRHAHMLGAKDPLMHRLVPVLVKMMGAHFQELVRAEALIAETLKLEESRFKTTLERGLKLLSEETGKLGEGEALAGEVAFTLYDTYGFPVDLTQDILRGQGRPLDQAGFEAAMERQRAQARKAWAGSGEAATDAVWFDLKQEVGATDFLGYETERAEGAVTAIVKDGEPVERIEAGDAATILVNQTPFYGESGGQQGDTGAMESAEGARFAVSDTQKKLDDLHVHVGTLESGALAVGDAVTLSVAGDRRTKLRANHSVTHLAHQALREVLGDHVTQKGSLVAPETMRFDFSHPKPMTAEEVAEVERRVNAQIRANAAVSTRLMTPDDAVEAGALALFGEKYGEEVRVVSMGAAEATAAGATAAGATGTGGGLPGGFYSVELCGGTHVGRTGDIGLFKIVDESAVAAGVRRITCLTGEAALRHIREEETALNEAAAALRSAVNEVPNRVVTLLDERKKLERELSELRRKLAAGGGGGAAPAPAAKDVAGIKFASRVLQDVPPKELKPLADQLKKDVGSGVVAVVAVNEGKASLVVGVTDDLKERFDAVSLVRVGAEAIGGKGGGGRPDMAQAGGPDGAAADKAVAAIEGALG
ncbi:MAG: alanine--tRNA ligase [Alphaproteobacteria bacterium]|nr:alanine--tRNA ligase [Alphaproteobacteria bacterium]